MTLPDGVLSFSNGIKHLLVDAKATGPVQDTGELLQALQQGISLLCAFST